MPGPNPQRIHRDIKILTLLNTAANGANVRKALPRPHQLSIRPVKVRSRTALIDHKLNMRLGFAALSLIFSQAKLLMNSSGSESSGSTSTLTSKSSANSISISFFACLPRRQGRQHNLRQLCGQTGLKGFTCSTLEPSQTRTHCEYQTDRHHQIQKPPPERETLAPDFITRQV